MTRNYEIALRRQQRHTSRQLAHTGVQGRPGDIHHVAQLPPAEHPQVQHPTDYHDRQIEAGSPSTAEEAALGLNRFDRITMLALTRLLYTIGIVQSAHSRTQSNCIHL